MASSAISRAILRSSLLRTSAFISTRSHSICLHKKSLGVLLPKLQVQQQWRFYSPDPVSQSDVESRVLTVCKAFDKITADKVSLDAHFINDLGLDSLDHVEVIMAIEDEFGFEIPDEHAEKLLTPGKIAQYVFDHETVGGVNFKI